jgi:heme-degrading monooxygenase HmoA
MSVYVSMRINADRGRFDEVAAANREKMREITERSKTMGAIHHRFAATDDGQVVVMDEWESREQFQSFFEGSPDIGELLQQAGVQGPPEISFYEPLTVGDEF